MLKLICFFNFYWDHMRKAQYIFGDFKLALDRKFENFSNSNYPQIRISIFFYLVERSKLNEIFSIQLSFSFKYCVFSYDPIFGLSSQKVQRITHSTENIFFYAFRHQNNTQVLFNTNNTLHAHIQLDPSHPAPAPPPAPHLSIPDTLQIRPNCNNHRIYDCDRSVCVHYVTSL